MRKEKKRGRHVRTSASSSWMPPEPVDAGRRAAGGGRGSLWRRLTGRREAARGVWVGLRPLVGAMFWPAFLIKQHDRVDNQNWQQSVQTGLTGALKRSDRSKHL